MRTGFNGKAYFISILAIFASVAAIPGTAYAETTDIERLQQCDRDLCDIALRPQQAGEALQCDVSKVWYKEDIAKSATEKHLSWPYGDAKCSLKIEVDRTLLAKARIAKTYTLKLPSQTVHCEVKGEEGTPYPLKVTLAPEGRFKDGRIVWLALHVGKIEGSKGLSRVVWLAVKAEANLGIFHKNFLKGINDYLTGYCPKTYGEPL